MNTMSPQSPPPPDGCPMAERPIEEELDLARSRALDQLLGGRHACTPPMCPMDGVVIDRQGDPLD